MSYLELALGTKIESDFTPTHPSSRQVIGAALRRLELGETQAIRLYSHTCKGQFLILRDDEIPESITVNCPTFTLAELKRLIGSDSEHIKAAYKLKQIFSAKVD